ncbi:MAG: SAM-dependent methyltransferase [Sciscionella sp.]|nr:SAM-dependent methyltransferase [Sciscionella sp.]
MTGNDPGHDFSGDGSTGEGFTEDAAPPAPDGVDINKPAAARIYDYYLGGAHNFKADREFAEQVISVIPFVRNIARVNRSFLRRTVTWLAKQGVDQFLDIGSGIPTVGNVHEIAQRINPDARTVYVDYEHVAVAHSRMILDEQDPHRERTDIVQADLRDPAAVLDSPITARLLDFDRPIAVMIVAVIQFIGDADRPGELLAQYRDRLTSGSYLTLSNLSSDEVPPEWKAAGDKVVELYKHTTNPLFLRTREEFTAFFTGFELVEPGVVWEPQWRPDEPVPADPSRSMCLGGVGRKP